VIAYARKFLDEAVPLSSGSWADATGLSLGDGRLLVSLKGEELSRGLANPGQFAGYTGELGYAQTGRYCWSTTGCTSRS